VNQTIKKKYDTLKIQVVKFKVVENVEIFIISEYDSILENLEDDILNVEIFLSGSSTYAYEDDLDAWMKKLSLMQ